MVFGDKLALGFNMINAYMPALEGIYLNSHAIYESGWKRVNVRRYSWIATGLALPCHQAELK